MYALRYRELLPPGVLEEFESMAAWLRVFLSEHADADGSLRLGTWTPYDVAWRANGAAPSLGNGQLHGRYMRLGPTVFYTIQLVAGSTTTFGSGAWIFSMPIPALRAPNLGTVLGLDSAPGAYYTGVAPVAPADGGLSIADNNGVWDAATPFAWGTDDGLVISGHYEAA